LPAGFPFSSCSSKSFECIVTLKLVDRQFVAVAVGISKAAVLPAVIEPDFGRMSGYV
jgi:hypothetical protein